MQPHKPRTAYEAIGRWPHILRSFGIDPRYLNNKHGPCPMCKDGTDRYRFDDKEGRGTWFCSRCGSGDGFALLQNVFGWNFANAAKQVDQVVGTFPVGLNAHERTEECKAQALQATWKGSKPVIKGDPVWCYLNRRTGVERISADVQFHPALGYVDENGAFLGMFPAMVALMRYPDGKPASIHRTYLTPNGEKAAVAHPKKIMPGKKIKTAAVRLGPVARTLGFAEGIETALATSGRFLVPVWAATNASNLADWEPPTGVDHVLIAGDNDANYTGQVAAYALARRLVREGYTVRVEIPQGQGKDWADDCIELHNANKERLKLKKADYE